MQLLGTFAPLGAHLRAILCDIENDIAIRKKVIGGLIMHGLHCHQPAKKWYRKHFWTG
jgi:hypothetical protein